MNYRLDIYATSNRLAAVRCFTAVNGKTADTEARRIISACPKGCDHADLYVGDGTGQCVFYETVTGVRS